MKKLGLSVGFSIIVCSVLFFSLRSFFIDTQSFKLIISISVTLFAFFVWLFHTFFTEHEKRFHFPTEPSVLVSRNGYGLPWHMLYVYGVLFFFFVKEGIGFILGFVASQLIYEEYDVSHTRILLLIVAIFGFIVIYHVGIWVGRRTELSFSLGIAVVSSIVVTSVAISKTIEFVIVPILSEQFLCDLYYDCPTLRSFFYHIWSGFWINNLFGILGFCIGWKSRLIGYMNFLLRRIPKDVRKDFVDLAYQEAQKTINRISK